jgi:acyl CoA:acetate/3-ketoacid CoA transferase beta subunit
MASNRGHHRVTLPFGEVSLLEPLRPDIVLMHAPVADQNGNVAFTGPLLEGMAAAWAARRGAIVTVDRVVETLAPYGEMVRLPAHRVLAVAEVPFGAHPGGVFVRGLPAVGYGEDIPFWAEARRASRRDFDAWIKRWCLDVSDQSEYLRRLGEDRLQALRARCDPETWRADVAAHPVDEALEPSSVERCAVVAAGELTRRIMSQGSDVVLAGGGVSNLAAWIGVDHARAMGAQVTLTAEMGMLGYHPLPADPYVFNHRMFPGAEMLCDMSTVLGILVSGPGTRSIGMLAGAEVDRVGNINSTDVPGTNFLAGSGGAADVASGADECIVVMPARPARLPERVAYITSPGRKVTAVCTELGILRKREADELRIAAVTEGTEPLSVRVARFRDNIGWEVALERDIEEVPQPTTSDAIALRRFDPERLFLTD